MPKRTSPSSVADAVRRGAKLAPAVLAKGDALTPRRSAASRQGSPRATPRAAMSPDYGKPVVTRPIAYGPPPEAFQGEIPPAVGAVSGSVTAPESLAPRPIVDKFPIIIGAGLSFAYLSACQRTALTGYRMQWVDLAREILERDPHLFAVVRKIILGIVNGRLEITPPELPPGHPDIERAKEIAADTSWRFSRIRSFKQSLYTLGWGAYYGVGAAELHYRLEDDGGWIVDHLGFIHSRRLSYPDMGTWDLYIWDQGQVLSAEPYGSSPTNRVFGLRVADVPQKFIVYAPQISGDYPTREGLARLVLEWALSKRLNARVALRYLERFVTPWPEATYNTGDPDSENPEAPREATTDDIAQATAAMGALGVGGLSSWVHPDSVEVNLASVDQGRPKITFKEFLDLCNEEISKGAVGGTLTTSGGHEGGNRALGSEHKAEEVNVISFFADCMASDLKDQLATPLVLLNHPDAQHLVPNIVIHVGDVDTEQLMKLATDAAKNNVPVDADKIATDCGLPVVPKPDGAPPRRMMPLDVTAPADLDPHLTPEPPPGTKGGATLDAAKAKAAQPHVMPGAPDTSTPAPNDKGSKGAPAATAAKKTKSTTPKKDEKP